MKKIFALMLFCLAVTASGFCQLVTVPQLQQDSPIQVLSAELQNFQYTSKVQIQLSGFPADSVKAADFRLYIYRNGKIIAGEGWTEEPLQSNFVHDAVLQLRPHEKAILAIQRIVTNDRTYSVSEQEIVNAVKAHANGRPQPLYGNIAYDNISYLTQKPTISSCAAKSVRLLGAAYLLTVDSADWCTSTALGAATTACGPGKIASFSCNNQNQSFSFTCKGDPAPEPPPDK